MTVGRLRKEMAWNELRRWMQFFELHPYEYDTAHRAEFMSAQIAAMVANTFRSEPVLPDDLMIKFKQEPVPDFTDIKAFFIANGIDGTTTSGEGITL